MHKASPPANPTITPMQTQLRPKFPLQIKSRHHPHPNPASFSPRVQTLTCNTLPGMHYPTCHPETAQNNLAPISRHAPQRSNPDITRHPRIFCNALPIMHYPACHPETAQNNLAPISRHAPKPRTQHYPACPGCSLPDMHCKLRAQILFPIMPCARRTQHATRNRLERHHHQPAKSCVLTANDKRFKIPPVSQSSLSPLQPLFLRN